MTLPSPQNILCPVDFSAISALGLRFAAAMARCSNARLTVMYADLFLPPPYFTESRLEEMKQHIRDHMKQAEASLGQFVLKTLGLPLAPVNVKVVEALPVDGILRVVGETHADLITMGTHGRSGFNRLMLGSVTERVLRGISIPVLTVHPGVSGPGPLPAVKNVLCPVNNSEVARRSLGYAAQWAQCFGAELTVLHVREAGAKDSIDDLGAWVPEESRSRCAIRELVREGEPAHEIVAAASQLHPDLLVLGSSHRHFFEETILGTTTVRVVRHSPCAVLVVPAKGPEPRG